MEEVQFPFYLAVLLQSLWVRDQKTLYSLWACLVEGFSTLVTAGVLNLLDKRVDPDCQLRSGFESPQRQLGFKPLSGSHQLRTLHCQATLICALFGGLIIYYHFPFYPSLKTTQLIVFLLKNPRLFCYAKFHLLVSLELFAAFSSYCFPLFLCGFIFSRPFLDSSSSFHSLFLYKVNNFINKLKLKSFFRDYNMVILMSIFSFYTVIFC